MNFFKTEGDCLFEKLMRYNRAMDEKVRKALPQINKVFSQEKPIVAAYLYGSYATNRAFQQSDIDIALLLEPDAKFSLHKILELAAEVEKVTSLRPIDLRILNEMPLSLQGEVLVKGVLLYSGDEKLRVKFEVKTLKLYFDYLAYLKRMKEEFLKKVALKGIL